MILECVSFFILSWDEWVSLRNSTKYCSCKKRTSRMFIRPNFSPKLVPDFLIHQLKYDGLFENLVPKDKGGVFTSLVRYRILVDFRDPFNLWWFWVPHYWIPYQGCDPLCNHDHFMLSKHWANGAQWKPNGNGHGGSMEDVVCWYIVAVDGRNPEKQKAYLGCLKHYVTSCDKVYTSTNCRISRINSMSSFYIFFSPVSNLRLYKSFAM